ncbi:MAG: four helix bundle protein [Kiritimatiellales bacterium]|nr:four helix bundle protein [Kiritimatiellales bacterium]
MAIDSPLRQKSYDFAVRTVNLCKKIMKEEKEYVLTKQLIRSGTSVGANIEEAQQASSRRDFAAKLTISLKEAYESRYWINLLNDTNYVSKEDTKNLMKDLNEVIAILLASTKTAKKNLQQ